MPGSIPPPLRLVPAVDRAARMLQMLEDERAPLSISELARRLDASKGSIREVLETLRYHGLVARDETTKLYRLGPRLIRIGAMARSRVEVGVAARPYLEALAHETGEAALLLLAQGDRLVIHEKAEPDQRVVAMSVSAMPGTTMPLLAGACGKVVLAFGDASAVEPRARKAAASAAQIEAVRAAGYAVDDQEFLDGIRGVSAPVLEEDGELACVILVSGLAASLASDRLEQVGIATALAGRRISAALGAPLALPAPGSRRTPS